MPDVTTRQARRSAQSRLMMLTLCLVLMSACAFPLGILIPRMPEYSAIELSDADIKVEVTNNLAKTRVVQEFFNPNSRQLEADFYFPVPKNANVTDFVLYMNGKPVKGEVLEKEKAREIYEGIVRRMKDPGLIEWIDYNLFKVRVFPVPANGKQKIELEFAQPLESDQGMFKYTFPMKTPKSGAERGNRPVSVKFAVDINSDEPLRNIYSPSHPIDTDTKDPKHAKVTVVPNSLAGGRGDFVLFYENSNKDVAVSLLANRQSGEDGFFSLMISPKVKYEVSAAEPIDVAFVIDTSGSMMDDNKIDQARRALTYCVSQLRENDRFGIIKFSTETYKYQESLQPASKDNIEKAKNWISSLRAGGGTNINDALKDALSLPGAAKDSDKSTSGAASRVFVVVFITDGMPTVGTTNADDIIRNMKRETSGNVRVFAFGVGNDVNTKLLDRLAEETRAVSEYIRPGEDMEVPISRFFDKISRPAMTSLKLEMPGAEVYDVYPKELPDLFYGTQLTVFGRYKKAGATAIKVAGMVAGKPADFTYEKTLPDKETANEFVEKLWGTRKIGYLLDQIRLHGESSELKDEVVKLAKRYGVATPYTSFLVTEDEPVPQAGQPVVMKDEGRLREHMRRTDFNGPQGMATAKKLAAESPSMSLRARHGGSRSSAAMPAASALAPGSPPSSYSGPSGLSGNAGGSQMSLESSSGSAAVDTAKAISSMKLKSDVTEESPDAEAKQTGGKLFRLANGVWTDSELQSSEQPALRIKYLSDAYFQALKLNPKLKDIFSLGERVRVKLPNGIVEVGPDGKDKLDEADAKILKQ